MMHLISKLLNYNYGIIIIYHKFLGPLAEFKYNLQLQLHKTTIEIKKCKSLQL